MGGKKPAKKTDEEKAAEAKEKADAALVKACKLGDTKASVKNAESAVAKGADVNLQSGSNENTPMHLAAMFGSLQVIVYLHSVGAALDVKNKFKRTALESAQTVGEEKAATVLESLAAGLPVDLSKIAVSDDEDEDDDAPIVVPPVGDAVEKVTKKLGKLGKLERLSRESGEAVASIQERLSAGAGSE